MEHDPALTGTAKDAWSRREALKTYVLTQAENAKTRLMGKRAVWDRMDKYWRSFRFNKPFPWRANVWNPISFFLVETVFPQMVMSIFQSPRKIFDVGAMGEEDLPAAKQMDLTINYQLLHEMDAYLPLLKMIKSSLIFGTAVGKLGWDGAKEGPWVKHIKLTNFLWDPDAEDFEDAAWKAEERWVSYEHLKDMERQGLYHDIALVDRGGSRRPSDEEPNLEVRNLQAHDPLRTIQLIEFWGPVPERLLFQGGGDQHVPALVVIANKDVLIRAEPNPFDHGEAPFAEAIDHLDVMDAMGLGELEPIESLQTVSSDLMSQYLDGRNLELNAMWLASRHADVNVQGLVTRPGGVVLAGDVAQVQRLDWKNHTPTMIADQNFFMQMAQMGLGVTNLSAGLQGANTPDTATGTEMLMGAAGKRIGLKLFLFNVLTMRKIGRLLVEMNKQLLPDSKVVRLLGDHGQPTFSKVLRHELAGRDFDVFPVASSLFGNPNFQVRELTNLLGILLGRFAQVQPTQVNPQPILEKILDIAGIQDTRILSSQQPMMDVLPQASMDAAKMNGQRGMPPLSAQNVPATTGLL